MERAAVEGLVMREAVARREIADREAMMGRRGKRGWVEGGEVNEEMGLSPSDESGLYLWGQNLAHTRGTRNKPSCWTARSKYILNEGVI